MEETNLFEKETTWPSSDADFFKLGIDENRIILKSNPKLGKDFFNMHLTSKRQQIF